MNTPFEKIEDLFHFQKKSLLKAGEGKPEGKFPFYTSSNELSKFIDICQYEKESLILGTGGLASVHYNQGNFAASTDCFILTPIDRSHLYPKYIFYYLSGNIHILEEGFKGAGLKHLSKKYLSNLKVPCPSLDNQQRIANILDNADSICRKNKQELQYYNDLSQSVFHEMFGDPIKDSKKFGKKKIKDIGKVLTGNTPSRKISDYYGDYLEWIKTDNINTPAMYLTKASEYLSEKGQKVARVVDPGAILVTCIAGSRRVIGNASLANRRVAFNQQINALVPKDGNSLFLYYHFLIAKKYIQSFSTSSMKGMITKRKFEQIEFIQPPKELQNRFGDIIIMIEKQKEFTRTSLKKSEDLFQSLLQRAFKGEL